jgi:predicted SAM-dependent methyltransferase
MGVGINIGCDVFRVKGHVNVDIRTSVGPDVAMDASLLAFRGAVADEINLGNVLEHLRFSAVDEALRECHRVLRPGGVLYVTSPMVDLAEQAHFRGEIEWNRLHEIICGEDAGYNMHRILLRSGDLEEMLESHGFTCEPLDLATFPYLVVSNVRSPIPDPWQYGVRAVRKE